jgi:hypothetical protein
MNTASACQKVVQRGKTAHEQAVAGRTDAVIAKTDNKARREIVLIPYRTERSRFLAAGHHRGSCSGAKKR